MTLSVRRLGPGDEGVLDVLARDDADFDVEGHGQARASLDRDAARTYLADAAVLHWVAEERGAVLGAMSAYVLRKRAGDPAEVLLYEIGVRSAHRRRGIGRALIAELDRWMRAHDVREVWVLAGNAAAMAFYRACGFEIPRTTAVYLQRRLDPPR